MSRDTRGRYLPGPDPDRHALTRAERRKGYLVARARAEQRGWDQMAWLYYRVRGWYRAQQ